MDINWIAVLVAAVSAFMIGGIWYGPLFGKKWMELVGKTEEDIKDANMLMIYGPVLVINILAVAGWNTRAVGYPTTGASAFGVRIMSEFCLRQD